MTYSKMHNFIRDARSLCLCDNRAMSAIRIMLGIIGVAKIIHNSLILICVCFQGPKSPQFLLNFVVRTEI